MRFFPSKTSKVIITYEAEDYQNRLRHYRCIQKINSILSHLVFQKLKQVKYVREISDHNEEDEFKIGKAYNAIKHCRRFIVRQVEKIGGCPSNKSALLFPSITEAEINLESLAEWKLVIKRRKLQTLGIKVADMKDKEKFGFEIKSLEPIFYRLRKQLPRTRRLRVIEIGGKIIDRWVDAIKLLDKLIPYVKDFLEGIILRIRDKRHELPDSLAQLSLFDFVRKIRSYSFVEENFFQFVMRNSRYFKKLQTLELHVNRSEYDCPDLPFLRNICELTSLKILSITINSTTEALRSFFLHLTMPLKLEEFELEIEIENDDWTPLLENHVNPFETSSLFKNFMNQWTSLKELKVLKINCSTANRYNPGLLTIAILERLPNSLENFEVSCTDFMERERIDRGEPPSEDKIIDFGSMLNVLATYHKKLTSVSVYATVIGMRNFSPANAKNFSLENITLDGMVVTSKSIAHLLQMVTDTEWAYFHLWSNVIRGAELSSLLTSISKRTKKFKINIFSIFIGDNKQYFLESLIAFINDLSGSENLTLEFETRLDFRNDDLERLGELLRRKPVLDSFDVSGREFGLTFKRKWTRYYIQHLLHNGTTGEYF